MTLLGVFFTRGVSLQKWLEAGLYDREVAIYREHLRNGTISRIYWFTYGYSDDALALELIGDGRLPTEVVVVPCPGWLMRFGRGASAIYSILLPFLMGKHLRCCDLFKTNQMEGAGAAVMSSVIYRRPLYVRTGYTLSRTVEKVFPNNLLRRGVTWLTEYLAFHYSDKSSVSSQYDLDYVVKRYKLEGEKLPVVVGNFVDTNAFFPIQNRDREEKIVFVGRLSPEKNLEMAIKACADVGIGLDIVGDGYERKTLEKVVRESGAKVRWLGVLANDELPNIYCRYKYFILPSLWEGMPKALLEAMASGLVCIGNNATGIREIINDEVTGYLASGPSASELAHAIRRAMKGDPKAVSMEARNFVCRKFSLGTIVSKEAQLFKVLLSESMPSRAGKL